MRKAAYLFLMIITLGLFASCTMIPELADIEGYYVYNTKNGDMQSIKIVHSIEQETGKDIYVYYLIYDNDYHYGTVTLSGNDIIFAEEDSEIKKYSYSWVPGVLTIKNGPFAGSYKLTDAPVPM